LKVKKKIHIPERRNLLINQVENPVIVIVGSNVNGVNKKYDNRNSNWRSIMADNNPKYIK
jgi:hypothetical protein